MAVVTVPLSSDPDKRAVQLANLKTGAATQHGAWSPDAIRPLREKYLTELLEEFPNASRRVLEIQAHRAAQIQLLADFQDERGVIRHKRRGDVFPAVALGEKIAGAYERTDRELRERERASVEPGTDLESYLQATYGGEAER